MAAYASNAESMRTLTCMCIQTYMLSSVTGAKMGLIENTEEDKIKGTLNYLV